MLTQAVTTIERSEPFIANLLQSRETGWEGLTTADVAGELALSAMVYDPFRTDARLLVITGGAASGKSTLAEAVSNKLAQQDVPSAVISSDDYVRGDRGSRRRWEANGMRPDGKYDFRTLRRAIGAVCANRDPRQVIELPQYDPHTGLAIDGSRKRQIPMVDVLIIEGDMLGEAGASHQSLYPEATYKPQAVYLHVPDEERLRRRVERDMRDRNGHGETPDVIADSFEHRQRTQHLPYTLRYASVANAILTPAANGSPYGDPTYDMYTMW